MALILKFLLGNWKEIILVIMVVTTLTLVYNNIYDRGAQQTNLEWQERIEKMEEQREARIDTLEQLAKTTIEQTLIANDKVAHDLDKLRKVVNEKPLTTIPNCAPSESFIDMYNKAIKKGNEK